MNGKLLSRSLIVIALLGLAGAAQAGTHGNTCDPADPPWGKPLIEPPSIVPENGVLDTTFVVRKKDVCIPVWSTNLCKGTYTRCETPYSTDWPCSAEAPCENAQRCVGKKDQVCGGKTKDGKDDPPCPDGLACAKTWGWDKPRLRTYGYPKDPDKPVDPSNANDPNLEWALPGPTLRARTEILTNPSAAKSASNPAKTPGTRIKVALHNYLDPQVYGERQMCDPAGTSYQPTYPECFHGSEITNLHYHGTHVSPQPHQDYVLLELWPYRSSGVVTSEDTQIGLYQTDINPLPWNQAPGTHWYHPHKHGSTSIQVLNGMSGALLIDGPFDDWLNGFYGGELEDRLMMVQQVAQELKYFNRELPDNPPQALVNGLATPQIEMRPGEIQRFRFVGATMQASAALEIGFDERIKEVRQIAQDGVQFAWQNYERQPLRDSAGTYANFDLSPGNRADFLIKAPMEEGTYLIEHNVEMELAEAARELHRTAQSLEDRVPPGLEELEALVGDISDRRKKGNKPPIDPQEGTPLLFTIEVRGMPKPMEFPVTQKADPACAGAKPPKHCWPKTPAYLEDLPEVSTEPRYVAFSMKGAAGSPPSFYINKNQYQHSCVGASMAQAATEDWHVSNVKYTPGGTDGLLAHPFHIHINPFQVVRDSDRTFEPPYIWKDTIALPVVSQVNEQGLPSDQRPLGNKAEAKEVCPSVCDGNKHAKWTGNYTSTTCSCQQVTGRPAGPIWNNEDAKKKCPVACAADNSTWNGNWRTTRFAEMSECDCEVKSDSVLIRQKFEDYTGAYVIHCHFLGHEDRGMMWNVQTVCDSTEPWQFGEPQMDGGPDNCPGKTEALLCCVDQDSSADPKDLMDCAPR